MVLNRELVILLNEEKELYNTLPAHLKDKVDHCKSSINEFKEISSYYLPDNLFLTFVKRNRGLPID